MQTGMSVNGRCAMDGCKAPISYACDDEIASLPTYDELATLASDIRTSRRRVRHPLVTPSQISQLLIRDSPPVFSVPRKDCLGSGDVLSPLRHSNATTVLHCPRRVNRRVLFERQFFEF